MMTPLLPNAGEASILGTSAARKSSNWVYRLLTGLQFASPSSHPFGMTMLKRATGPVASLALKVDIPALWVPAGMSLAKHSAEGVAGDHTPPGPSMSSNSIGGLPVVENPASGQAVLLGHLPPDPVSQL